VSASQLIRTGALFLLIGGVLGLLGAVLSLPSNVDFKDQVASPLFLPSNWLNLVGGLIAVIGFPAAYAVIAQRSGPIGLIGFLGVMLAGMLLPVSSSVLSLLMAPALVALTPPAGADQGPPGFVIYFTGAGVIALVGAVLFGIAIIRSGVFSRWPGYLLILAGFVNLVVNFLPNVPGSLGGVVFNVALAWIGYELWRVASGSGSEPTWLRSQAA
jgi:hypothetical protein